MSEEKSVIGQVIDADTEEIADILTDYSYGQLTNIKKGLEMEYARTETVKNQIAEQIEKDEVEDGKEQLAQDTLDELYVALQRIEDRACIVEELKRQKSIDAD